MQKIGGTILTIVHVRYIKILTLLRGFRVNFFHDSIVWQFPEETCIEHKENHTKYRNMTRKPRSHARILIYRTWAYVQSGKWSFKTLFKMFAVR